MSASEVLCIANEQPGPLAPGEALVIQRRQPIPGLPANDRLRNSFETGRAGTQLGPLRVLFDGQPAALLAATANTIKLMAPFELDGKQATSVQLEVNGVAGPALTLPVVAAAPALYVLPGTTIASRTFNYNPNTYGAIDNTPAHPVERGGVLSFYATGAGQTNSPGRTGSTLGLNKQVAQKVQVTIDGVPADVLYAGSAVGLLEGIVQVNVRVPAGAPSGAAVPLRLQVGDAFSQDQTTIAVR